MQKRGFWPQNYAGAAAKKLPRPSLFPAPGGMGHKTMLAPLRKSSPDPHFLPAPGAQDCTKKEGLATKLCWRRYEKSSPDPHFFPPPGAQDRIFFRPPPRLARGAPPAAPPRFQYENRGQGTPQRRVRTSAHSPIQSGHLGKIRIPRRVVQPAAPARNSLHWLVLWQRRNAERNFSTKTKKKPKKKRKKWCKIELLFS